MSCLLHIIIPHWHGGEYLGACLENISRSTFEHGVNWNVVIVHNGGESPSIPDFMKARVKVLNTSENIGFARAVNVGLHFAIKENADFIALLNQDALVHPECFQALLGNARTTNAFYAPLIMDYTMSHVAPWYAEKYYHHVSLDSEKSAHELQAVSATCILANRETFEFGGYFDPAFYMYYEDDDYFDRLRSRGGKVYVVPSAHVGHLGGSTESVAGNSMLMKRAGVLKHLIRHRGIGIMLRRALRHYGSAIYRFDLKRLGGYLKSDLSTMGRYRYLRRADHAAINASATQYIVKDMNAAER